MISVPTTMINVATFVFNEFQENTYVAWDETGDCVVVDPGCYTPDERQLLHAFLIEKNLRPVGLLNTHCHIDHILGNHFVASTFDVPLYLHRDELQTYHETGRWAAMFGLVEEKIPVNQVYVNEGDVILFGNSSLDIAFTPGHSIASITFYNKAELLAFSGDVLFRESIGRTDLPGGNFNTLITSIRTKLLGWDDETIIYSGHGPVTNIGYEKTNNPYLI